MFSMMCFVADVEGSVALMFLQPTVTADDTGGLLPWYPRSPVPAQSVSAQERSGVHDDCHTFGASCHT